MLQYVVHTDGGARGNPGPAGAGVVIADQAGNILHEIARPLGTLTNNQAEYWAVIYALEHLVELRTQGQDPIAVNIHLDSQLVAEQLAGNYKIKNEGLKPLYDQARVLIETLGLPVTFRYIPRRENKHADALANRAMDEISVERT